jgi:hypothetical protein
MPDFPVNSIVDNLILMSIVEINDSLHRCISVVKARGSNHSNQTREFVIGAGGIAPVAQNKSVEITAPLHTFSSLLGRAPTRLLRRLQRKQDSDVVFADSVLVHKS